MLLGEMVSAACPINSPSIVLLIPRPKRDIPPGRAFIGIVPNKGGRKGPICNICNKWVILQEIKQAFQTQESHGLRKRSWWKPGDLGSNNFWSAMLIPLVWKVTYFIFTNLFLFFTCRAVSKCHLVLTSDFESNTNSYCQKFFRWRIALCKLQH